MQRCLNVLLIFATIYVTVTKCLLPFDDGFHHYDKQHLRVMLQLLRTVNSDTQQELRLIFKNSTLTKQELNETIREWAKKRAIIFEEAIISNLNELQQQIMEMQNSAKNLANITMQEQNDLLAILEIKANMSLTNSEEIFAIKKLMESLNRTDRIRLRAILRQNFLNQKRIRRSIQQWLKLSSGEEEEFDENLNECEPFFSCQFNCGSSNDYNFDKNFNITVANTTIETTKNFTDTEDLIILGGTN
ncbi:hypothetical protein LOAG_03014 [Loa loa]|uniref:SXP/RAL-2 family protein Ani s 5-like cation-binding domain-containing protein n=1 Tax=Loa loa TaxID=7209 RepID=A0A1I7W2X0_LOALO|nr:hypothetical protein LOAG_03014 [Loa loa]EFO25470.2 hypothetical protein LOAG_03014 [Loa loa]